jgi:hypothetical protein
MSNDAKVGLVVGMGLVVTVAVVFFRKEVFASVAGPSNKPISAAVSAAPMPVDDTGKVSKPD